MSFFGFVIKSNSSHPEKVPAGCNLVLTQAATDKSASEPTTLYCQTEEIKDKLVICSLTWGRMEQARLDLIFESETEVTFSVSGKGDIHVSGYFVEEELPPDFDSEDEEDEEDVDEMESSPISKKKEKSPQGKRPLSNAEQDKSPKKAKAESPKQESPKTSKPETKSESAKTESPKTVKAESPKNESPKTESPKKKKDKKGGDNKKDTETKETKSPSQEKKVENGGEKSKKNKKKGKGKK